MSCFDQSNSSFLCVFDKKWDPLFTSTHLVLHTKLKFAFTHRRKNIIYRRSLFSVFGFVYAGFYSVDCFTMNACREQSYYFPSERFHSNGYQKWDIRNDKEMSSFMHLNQHNT